MPIVRLAGEKEQQAAYADPKPTCFSSRSPNKHPVRVLLKNLYFLVSFANLIQNESPWKREPQLRNCFHQIACKLEFRSNSLVYDMCGKVQLIVESNTPG